MSHAKPPGRVVLYLLPSGVGSSLSGLTAQAQDITLKGPKAAERTAVGPRRAGGEKKAPESLNRAGSVLAPKDVTASIIKQGDALEAIKALSIDETLSILGMRRWPRPEPAKGQAAQAALVSLRDALYVSGNMPAAQEALETALGHIESITALPSVPKDISDGLWLGVHLLLISQQVTRAKQVAALGLRLAPNPNLPEAAFSPRVRQLVADVASSASAPTFTHRPVDCHPVRALGTKIGPLLDGEYLFGLRCGGSVSPSVGAALRWDQRHPIDVTGLSTIVRGERLYVRAESLVPLVETLLSDGGVGEVYVISRAPAGALSVSLHTASSPPSTKVYASEEQLANWIIGQSAEHTLASDSGLHIGTYWGIGVASLGAGLLAGALGTWVMANDAIATTNTGTVNRISEAESLKLATWTLVGSGAALSFVGTVLVLVYEFRTVPELDEGTAAWQPRFGISRHGLGFRF